MTDLTRRSFLTRSLLGAATGVTTLALQTENQAWAQSRGIDPRELQAMQGVATDFMTKYKVPGLSVAIAKDDRLVYAEGFGMADQEKGEKVKPDNLFRIASVTKPFTSATLFRQVELGKLRLADKVFGKDSVLGSLYGGPPFRRYVEDITIEHLLTHTSGGWSNDGSDGPDPMFTHPEMDHKQLITETVQNYPLSHEPGTHYAYSNFGYCILGRVIEKVTGKPYHAAVQQDILERCGISDMRIAGNTLAQRYPKEVVYYGGGVYNMPVTRMDSHGGWIATPTDLVRFLARVDGFPAKRDILSEATLKTMSTASSANAGYAKGWEVNRANNWWHNGSLPGSSTIMVRTSSGFCWAALTNIRTAGIDLALDQMVWNMVGKVSVWPSYDLFKTS